MAELRKPQTIQQRFTELSKVSPYDTKLWGPIIERGAVTLLCGASGAGKTVLMYNLFGALTKGEGFLGLEPPYPLKVLQVDNESPDSVQQELLEKFQDCSNWAQLPRDATWEEVENSVAGYDILLIDILSTFSPTQDENDNSQAERQLLPFLFLAKKHNISIVLTYHLGKDDFAADLRGASARRAKTDIMVILYNKGEDLREIFIKKSRDGNAGKKLIYRTRGDWEDHSYEVVQPLGGKQGKAESMEIKILTLLKEHPDGLSGKEIRQYFGIPKNDTAGNKLITRVLHQSNKIVRKDGVGDYIKGEGWVYQLKTKDIDPLIHMDKLSEMYKNNDLYKDTRNFLLMKCEVLEGW